MLQQMCLEGNSTPVLCLTARDAIANRVAGLDLGANDHLVKPFFWEEMLERIRVLTINVNAHVKWFLKLWVKKGTHWLSPECPFFMGFLPLICSQKYLPFKGCEKYQFTSGYDFVNRWDNQKFKRVKLTCFPARKHLPRYKTKVIQWWHCMAKSTTQRVLPLPQMKAG